MYLQKRKRQHKLRTYMRMAVGTSKKEAMKLWRLYVHAARTAAAGVDMKTQAVHHRHAVVEKMVKRIHTLTKQKTVTAWHDWMARRKSLHVTIARWENVARARLLHGVMSLWTAMVVDKHSAFHLKERESEWEERKIEQEQAALVRSELQAVKDELDMHKLKVGQTAEEAEAKGEAIARADAAVRKLKEELQQARRAHEQTQGELRKARLEHNTVREEHGDLKLEHERLRSSDASGHLWSQRVDELKRKLSRIEHSQSSLSKREEQLERDLMEKVGYRVPAGAVEAGGQR